LRSLGVPLLLWIGLCSPTAAAPPDKVLVLTPFDMPVVKMAADALKNRRTVDGQPLPPLDVDVRVIDPSQVERKAASELRPQLKRYKAVFATTLFLARALQMEDSHIPIVFEGAADPIQLCLVDSLIRPGRNATGTINVLPDEDAKLMEVLVDGFPKLKKIIYLVAGSNVHPASCDPDDIVWRKNEALPCTMGMHAPDDYLRRLVPSTAVVAQAKVLKVEVGFMVVCDAKDIARLPAMIKASPDIGFAIPWQGLFPEHSQALIDVLARMRRPAIYGRWFFAREGGVLAMEPIFEPVDRRASVDMLLQVLDGAAPATLPVQMPRGFRVMVNAPAAARQGLQPSLSLLRRADNVLLK
jgi:ABC-type uncharacterized transport system substrate-binding protein